MNIFDILTSLKSSFYEIISEDDLYDLLISKKDLIIKVGFDPTTESLHLGHVVILRKLRLFQDFGHKIYFLIGDFTAMIGDPSGRTESRKQIARLSVLDNFKTYKQQIFKILNPKLTFVYFNSSWLTSLSSKNFIDLMSNVTVSRLIERSDFKNRYYMGKPIYLHEFIYPLLQSYDSIFMNADIEFGGIDQKFNFLLARNLQKKLGYVPQVSIMAPILRGIDGKDKMSKSLGNCINMNDDFYDIFCKVMSISDNLVKEYYLFLGFFSVKEYELFISSENNFMFVKLDLSYRIVSLLYNSLLADEAKTKFINQFSKKNFFENVEVAYFNVCEKKYFLGSFLVNFGFISSYSDFKRLLKQGAIKVNYFVVNDRNFLLDLDVVYLLQVGKKLFLKIVLRM